MKKVILTFGAIFFASFILVGCADNGNRKSDDNSSTSSKKTEMIHRCGRTWNGERDKTYGVYGDYCCERCYADLYPN